MVSYWRIHSGNLRHQWAKFPRRSCAAPRDRGNSHGLFWFSRVFWLAQFLKPRRSEINVFRVTLLSIVLTLAVGQTVGLSCKVWCDNAARAGCSHQDSTTSPAVSVEGNCDCVAVGSVVFVREESRRTAVDSYAPNVPVHQVRLTTPPSRLRSDSEVRRRLQFEERPLVIALRI